MQASTIRTVVKTFQETQARIVIPSYQLRRGHPWLIENSLWNALLAMPAGSSLRDFLQLHQAEITYAMVDTPSILKDMDTPEDYQAQRPVDK